MENLVYLLPVLGCAVMIAVMMWMMRGNRASNRPGDGPHADAGTREEIAVLRAELAALREQQAGATGDRRPR